MLDFELKYSFDKWSIGFVSSTLRQTNQTTMHSGSSRQGKLVFFIILWYILRNAQRDEVEEISYLIGIPNILKNVIKENNNLLIHNKWIQIIISLNLINYFIKIPGSYSVFFASLYSYSPSNIQSVYEMQWCSTSYYNFLCI